MSVGVTGVAVGGVVAVAGSVVAGIGVKVNEFVGLGGEWVSTGTGMGLTVGMSGTEVAESAGIPAGILGTTKR